jgi:elongation factor G
MLRETIRESARGESRWIGNGEYAHVCLLVEPLQRGAGIDIQLDKAEQIAPKFLPSVEQGILRAIATGVLARVEMTDLRVVVVDGSYHEADSTPSAFQRTAEQAARETLLNAAPYLLEAMARISLTVPEEFMGTAIGDINSRRGLIEGLEHPKPGACTIKAVLPELEMGDFPEELSQATQGRGTYSRAFAGYEELPGVIAGELRYCRRCNQQVIPLGLNKICPNCGLRLENGGDDDLLLTPR